ncbi:MAG TPA: pilus assembly protein TadG-related protein [Dehalococcoidia bacterium]|nr:pilus assembly protein TadG-related protein [Dehalococcoidia bacterium]
MRLRCEGGQVLMVAALLIPVLLGMAAIAVDIGSYADDKRNLQNAADAIALAASRDMCTPDPHDCSNTSAAQATANTYAAKNDIDTSIMNVSFLGGNSAPKVRVTLGHSHSFAFMKVLGVSSKNVSVVAAAAKVSPGGVPGAVPFGVTQNTLDAAGYGQTVTLKYDASGGSISGNFGSIDIDGTGSPVYETDLKSGSPSVMCSVLMPDCDQTSCQSGGSFPDACAEDAPSCDGPVCETETGDKISGTRDGIQYRLDHTVGSCDTFDEVFTPASAVAGEPSGQRFALAQSGAGGAFLSASKEVSAAKPATNTPAPTSTPAATTTPAATGTPLGGGTGKYTLTPGCNPWAGAGQCPEPSADTGQMCSRRVIVIPIIDAFTNGKSPVNVQGFALMYLNGFANGGCSGNDCQVTGVFVNADVSMNALSCNSGAPTTCVYDPDSSVHFSRLVE